MSIEQQLTDLTEAVRALTVVMQSGGAAALTSAPTAAPTADTPAKGKPGPKPKAKEEAAAPAAAPAASAEVEKTAQSDKDTFKALVTKLVNSHDKGQGAGKEEAKRLFGAAGVKDVNAAFALADDKRAELIAGMEAFLAPAAEEEFDPLG